MKLRCLGSGSSGNCYILENASEALIIEAGVRFKDVKIALDFNVSKIVGVVISHSHGDHAKYALEYGKAGIPVIKAYEQYDIKNQLRGLSRFKVYWFDLVHDVPCYGFYITHPNMGSLVYATDTEYIKWRFKNVNHILVETNYSPDCMEPIDNPKRSHVLTGHMSIDTAVEFLKANTSPALRNVVLLHLSESNSDEEQFKAAVESVVDCPVWVAGKGIEVELNEFPF